jgi:hypothetical protein
MNAELIIRTTLIAVLMAPLAGFSQQPALPGPAIQGIQGPGRGTVKSIDKVDPVAVKSAANPTAEQVKKVEGIEPLKGVKVPAPSQVKGVQPPSSTQSVSAIRAVKGVTGIVVPKQRNLEAALLIKESTKAPERKNSAAAAALLTAPKKEPQTQKQEDGRAAFQVFAEKNTTGS